MTTKTSFSASGNRQIMAPAGPSVADTLPSINFGFDDLRDRMAKFTAKFDAFIEQGRKHVLEERNKFRMNIAEVQGTRHLKIRLPTTYSLITAKQNGALANLHVENAHRGPAYEEEGH